MNDKLKEMIKHLKLPQIDDKWDEIMAHAAQDKVSTSALLEMVFKSFCDARQNREQTRRLLGAKIPEQWTLASYPFARQPKLNKRPVINLHDSLHYLTKKQNLVLVGPTGVGKTGIGISFLIQAITHGYRGLFITFPSLISNLYRSVATHHEERLLRRFASYDCLMIDELGYVDVEPSQVGLFVRFRDVCTAATRVASV